MRIANHAGRLVLVTKDGAVDVERASGGRFAADPQAVYGNWDDFCDWVAVAPTGDAVPVEEAQVRAPVPAPTQIFGIGLNYRDHAAEAGLDLPESPAVFTKFASSLSGPSGEVTLAGDTVDWEAELVAVIGHRARHVPAAQGWDHIAGLTVGQDLSERTVQLAGPAPQFSLGKSFPGFAPTGPCLVTPDELPHRDDLTVGCSVNGESMQKGRTSDLVFSVPELVERLSAVLPLLPGDLIFTGTPAGIGGARNPKRFLTVGDELVTTVEGVGEMRHRLVPAEHHAATGQEG